MKINYFDENDQDENIKYLYIMYRKHPEKKQTQKTSRRKMSKIFLIIGFFSALALSIALIHMWAAQLEWIGYHCLCKQDLTYLMLK